MRRTVLVLAVVALVLVVLVPTASAGPIPKPFRGTSSGVFIVDLDPGCPVWLRSSTGGTGTGTLLGLTSWEASHCTPAGGGPVPSDPIVGGEFTFWAANGDRLDATYTGTVDPWDLVEGAIITATCYLTFVGGDGRFEDATGQATLSVRVTLATLELGEPSPGVFGWVGTLAY